MRAILTAGAEVIIIFLRVAALLLSPFAVSRLVGAVSIPHFRQHRLRTCLTVFGVALGVALLIAIVLVNRSITRSFEETVDAISGKADLQVSVSAGGIDEHLGDVSREVEGVWKLAPTVSETALIREPMAKGDRVLLIGIDLVGKDDEYFRDYDSDELPSIRENPLGFLNSKTNIIISRKLAKRYGLKTGDTIHIATPDGTQEFAIWGTLGETGAGRTFGGAVGLMYYQAMQDTFHKGVLIDRIDIAVKKGLDVPTVQAALQARLGKGIDVDRPDKRSHHVTDLIGGLQAALQMGSFIALLVGAFLIYNTMAISVVQRKRELGILRALGATKGRTLALITVEGILLGLVGSTLGLALGLGIANGMMQGMSEAISEMFIATAATNLHVDARLAATGFIVGVMSALISSLIPAREAMRTSPLEAMKAKSAAPPGRNVERLGAGDVLAAILIIAAFGALRMEPVDGEPLGGLLAVLALIGATVLFAPRAVVVLTRLMRALMDKLFGIDGVMANDNLRRDLSRIGITVGALSIGVAMATALGAFVYSLKTSVGDWIEETLPADLYVSASGSISTQKKVPMTPDLKDKLKSVEGVAEIEMVRHTDFDYQGDAIKLLSTDSEIWMRRSRVAIVQGTLEKAKEGMLRGEVIVSENFVRHYHTGVGQTIKLGSPSGAREFTIAGVIVDYGSDKGTVLMDRATRTAIWGDQTVDTFKVYLSAGADIESVRKRITQAWGEKYDLFVLTNSEVKESLSQMIDQSVLVMRALEVVAVVIAVLGIVNALLANILDRTRELGVLRAIGMLRRRVRRMIVLEAGLVGLIGNVTGVLLGLVLGWIMIFHINGVHTGFYFAFKPPWLAYASGAVWILAAASAAGWYPARSAARLTITEALSYE